MLDTRQVRELAALQGAPVITSLYLDVDGRRYPRWTDYEPHFTALCHAARQQAHRWGEQAEASVETDLERMGRWLDAGIDRAATRGVAFFASGTASAFEVVALPVPVEDHVRVAAEADVSQLLALISERERTLVVLADRREARMVRAELGTVDLPIVAVDQPERQADTDVEIGSWEHRHEEATRRHFRRVARAVGEEVRRWGATAVLLSGADDDIAALRACMDEGLADHVAGTAALPVSAPLADIEAAALDLMRQRARDREVAALGQLEESAHHDRAVMGLSAVLNALGERRVAMLLVARGFAPVGARCPACGHVCAATCQCPTCGTPAVEADDLSEVVIDRALAQGATVMFCDAASAKRCGGIAALTRF